MSILITVLAARAKEMLDAMAVPCVIRRQVRSYDAGSRSVQTSVVEATGRGIVRSVGIAERVDDAAEREAYYGTVGNLVPDDFAPEVDDVLLLGGGEWRINGVTAVQPDGRPIVYRVALERA